MTEQEFYDFYNCGISFFVCFVILPATCIVYIMAGYIFKEIIYAELILTSICIYTFAKRTIFLIKHSKLNKSHKRFMFETISYISCLLSSIILGFFVHYSVDYELKKSYISYFDFSIYIQGPVIIYSIVLIGFMASTAKRIATLWCDYKENNKL